MIIISYYFLTKLLPTVPQCNTIGLTKKIQKEINDMAQKIAVPKDNLAFGPNIKIWGVKIGQNQPYSYIRNTDSTA